MNRANSFPNDPRIERTLRIARRFITQSNICWLPVDPVSLYDDYCWALYSCYEAEKVYGKSDPFGVRRTGVDAKTYYSREKGIYITVYDENILLERIRWTLMHEIGHIVLGHLVEFNLTLMTRGGLSTEQYTILEREANIFAAEVLAPMAILKAVGACNYDKICQICKISKEAAQNRVKDINWHGNKKFYREADEYLRKHFQTYLTPVAICTNQSVLPTRISINKRSRVDLMNKKHKYVSTDNRGRFLFCPRCGNKSFSKNAKYCKMCGLYLYNSCTNTKSLTCCCGMKNPGDARYCEHCGQKTLLTCLGLLMTWEELIRTYGEVVAGTDPDSLGVKKVTRFFDAGRS